jgi:hypothetical protein
MTTTDVCKLRLAMQANGYQPLPAQGKKVLLQEWSTKGDVPQSEIALWDVQHPHWSNTSTLTGRTPTIDGDIRHPEAAEAFEELVREWLDERGTIMVRFGEAPKRAILCRTDKPFPKISASFVAPNGSTHKIEILGEGQQVVVAGIHPDTKQPYTWHGGEPWTVPRNELPEINEVEARAFVERASGMLERKFKFRQTQGGNGQEAGTEFAGQKPSVDVDKELAGIHYGTIHDTWKNCMGSLLRAGMPADDVYRRLLRAAEQSPACANDPKRNLWQKSLADLMVWYLCTEREFVLSLTTKMQVSWHTVVNEGRKPQLIWRADLGMDGQLYVRQSRSDTGAKQEQPEQPTDSATSNATGASPKLRFRLMSFCDLRPGPEPLYLVDELIPVAGLVDVWGKAKCYKSFWCLDLMLHVAMGWEYRDRYVQQGAVVYCAFEGAHGYKKRIEALRRHYSIKDDAQVPLYIMPGQANLIADHPALIADISTQLAEVKPVAVVLDTLNKSLVGSENKDTDMSAYVRAAEAIRDAFGCVVVIVHHCGYDDTRPRGHSSLPGTVDAQLAVTRTEEIITVTVEMMRDGPEDTQVVSTAESVEVGQDQNGKPLTSLVIVPSSAAAAPNQHRDWPRGLAVFHAALKTALASHGEVFQPEPGVLPVRAVDQWHVRDRFYDTYAETEENDAKRQAKLRQAFRRALGEAQHRGVTRVLRVSGKTMVWFPPRGES